MIFFNRLPFLIIRNIRQFSETKSLEKVAEKFPHYVDFSEPLRRDISLASALASTMTVHEDFLSENEENSLIDEVEPYMSNLKYEFDHWDDAIHGYRETERLEWNEANAVILNRVRKIAFPPHVGQLKHVHILDLDEAGHIKPHIDAVRFCGDTIAGLSLLSDSVMRLVHDKNKTLYADVLLKRRSLYIMKNTARFDYTHEILGNKFSVFKGKSVFKSRRVSVICRNEPNSEHIKA